MDKKRKASEAEKEALNEKIFLLLPPKSVKNDYVEQKAAKYVFQCSDGDIQIPEYGIMQTEFYYQEGIKFNSGFPGPEALQPKTIFGTTGSKRRFQCWAIKSL